MWGSLWAVFLSVFFVIYIIFFVVVLIKGWRDLRIYLLSSFR